MYKILVLEDEGPLVKNYIEQLERHRFDVFHSLDAKQSVKLVLDGRMDGVVVDLQLPVPEGLSAHEVENGDKTGLWFLDQIRHRMVGHPPMAVFVLTNNLAKHKARLEDFKVAQPILPRFLLEYATKAECGARALPARLKAQIATFRGLDGGLGEH